MSRPRLAIAPLLLTAFLSTAGNLSAVCGEAQAPPRDPARDRILGEWHGSSLCVDLERAPACHDEQVVYYFTRGTGWHSDRTLLRAYRLVAGKQEPMGELEFDYDSAAATWSSELETPRFHGSWTFQVEGDRLTGALLELPSQARLRRVSAAR